MVSICVYRTFAKWIIILNCIASLGAQPQYSIPISVLIESESDSFVLSDKIPDSNLSTIISDTLETTLLDLTDDVTTLDTDTIELEISDTLDNTLYLDINAFTTIESEALAIINTLTDPHSQSQMQQSLLDSLSEYWLFSSIDGNQSVIVVSIYYDDDDIRFSTTDATGADMSDDDDADITAMDAVWAIVVIAIFGVVGIAIYHISNCAQPIEPIQSPTQSPVAEQMIPPPDFGLGRQMSTLEIGANKSVSVKKNGKKPPKPPPKKSKSQTTIEMLEMGDADSPSTDAKNVSPPPARKPPRMERLKSEESMEIPPDDDVADAVVVKAPRGVAGAVVVEAGGVVADSSLVAASGAIVQAAITFEALPPQPTLDDYKFTQSHDGAQPSTFSDRFSLPPNSMGTGPKHSAQISYSASSFLPGAARSASSKKF